jgi:Fe-S-cluster containining protein
MTQDVHDLPRLLEDKKQLSADDSFGFSCHPGVPCFNRCCRDVNIIMTPLDVLGLARRLGLHTRDFLETYTGNPLTKDLQLPMVILKMRNEDEKRCPFVGDEGCTVYEDRPWACRMYPLGMAIPPARAGVEPEPIFFVFEDDHCEGRLQSDRIEWTPDSWRRDQGVSERDEIEAGFREIVSHPWFIGGRQLDPKRMHMFYTACYDLDTFRTFVFDSTFLDRFELEDSFIEDIKTNDVALLQFAFRWLRFSLFGEPTMQVREAAAAGSDR